MTINSESIIFYSVPLVASFGLSIIVTWWVRKFAVRLQVLDIPNEPRKVHTQPVPLWGGLSLFVTLISLTLVFWFSGWLDGDRLTMNVLLALLTGSFIITLGGLLDDKFSLRPKYQIIWPLFAALLAVLLGVSVTYVTDPRGGILHFNLFSFLPSIIAFLWVLGMMYTTKLLDGLDGLVTGIGAIAAIIIFIVSLSWNEPFSAVSVLSLVLAGATLGFLLFNWHPASIFLGEAGSVLIGFWLGMLSIISGSKIATALLIMGIPILDVIWVIVRRLFIEKKSLALSDSKHLHHRLLGIGLKHREVVIVLYFLTLLFGSISLFQHTLGKIIALGVLVIVMITLGLIIVKKKQIHE